MKDNKVNLSSLNTLGDLMDKVRFKQDEKPAEGGDKPADAKPEGEDKPSTDEPKGGVTSGAPNNDIIFNDLN